MLSLSLFSGALLFRSRIQAGLNAGHTVQSKGLTGSKQQWEKKKHCSHRKLEKNHNNIFTGCTSSGPLNPCSPVSKLNSVSRCTASGIWWCVRLASSGCKVTFVSAGCHCSPLDTLESHGVAVRGRERHDERERDTMRGGNDTQTVCVLLPGGQGNGNCD